MFHACAQRFDGMDEKFLGGELNRALETWTRNYELKCEKSALIAN